MPQLYSSFNATIYIVIIFFPFLKLCKLPLTLLLLLLELPHNTHTHKCDHNAKLLQLRAMTFHKVYTIIIIGIIIFPPTFSSSVLRHTTYRQHTPASSSIHPHVPLPGHNICL